MGLIGEIIQNILTFIPIGIAVLGVGMTSLIVIYFISEIWDALADLRHVFSEKFDFWSIFKFFGGIATFFVEILKTIIELLSFVMDQLPVIMHIIECIWNLDPNNLGMINILLDIFVEYFPVIYYIVLLIPMYIALYYLGEGSDMFL